MATAIVILAGGCSSGPLRAAPPTIEAARPALSPPAQTRPAGEVVPLAGKPVAALFDRSTASLVTLSPGTDQHGAATLTVIDPTSRIRTLVLPGPAISLTGDDQGRAYLSTKGGYFDVDLSAAKTARVQIPGEAGTDFTAIARRADGRMVLGSAGGTAYTLATDGGIAQKANIFAHIDAIATVEDVAVVLDRSQTSVTSLDDRGVPQEALRAGEGATTLVSDPRGRVLVADTRGGQLLVFGVDPLIERQAYPVSQAPYGLAGSAALAWVSQTAANVVIGYDLATGIPVEKVRYPTVQQPNSLAYDDTSDTLFVVSGSGAGVQVIRNAAGGR